LHHHPLTTTTSTTTTTTTTTLCHKTTGGSKNNNNSNKNHYYSCWNHPLCMNRIKSGITSTTPTTHHSSSSVLLATSSSSSSSNNGGGDDTSSSNTMDLECSSTGYLNAEDANALDQELMSTPGFSLEQLMELAGLSVAEAVYAIATEEEKTHGKKKEKENFSCLWTW
jgi:hypothetical protein